MLISLLVRSIIFRYDVVIFGLVPVVLRTPTVVLAVLRKITWKLEEKGVLIVCGIVSLSYSQSSNHSIATTYLSRISVYPSAYNCFNHFSEHIYSSLFKISFQKRKCHESETLVAPKREDAAKMFYDYVGHY